MTLYFLREWRGTFGIKLVFIVSSHRLFYSIEFNEKIRAMYERENVQKKSQEASFFLPFHVQSDFIKNFATFSLYESDLWPAKRRNLNETAIWLRSRVFCVKYNTMLECSNMQYYCKMRSNICFSSVRTFSYLSQTNWEFSLYWEYIIVEMRYLR